MLTTLTFKYLPECTYDIQVNNQQTIGETLQILQQKGMLPKFNPAQCVLKSMRTRQFLNPEMTYEENSLYTGDVIIINNER